MTLKLFIDTQQGVALGWTSPPNPRSGGAVFGSVRRDVGDPTA